MGKGFRVPDADLSAVLQPNNLSTFTAANGTSLDAITPEVGSVWVEQSGNWDIQGNRANQVTATTATYATVDSGIADAIVDVVVNPAASDDLGLILRYTDTNNMWSVRAHSPTNTLYVIERNAGVETIRASTAVTFTGGTDYDLRAVIDGQQIDAFADGGNKTSYGSAALNETETVHGITGYAGGGNTQVDNFACYPRTSTTYDTEFGKY